MARGICMFVALCSLFATAACSSSTNKPGKCTPGDAQAPACTCGTGQPGQILCDADSGVMVCECLGDGGVTRDAASAPAHDAGGNHGNDAGAHSTGSHDDAGNPTLDDDASVQASDAAIHGGNGKDAGGVSYAGPCTSDKQCPGADTCTHGVGVSYCASICTKDSQCPAPTDGSATPTCVGANPLLGQSGTCALSCGTLNGKCPRAMQCSALLILPGECVWQ
jgi:hypothetical protein